MNTSTYIGIVAQGVPVSLIIIVLFKNRKFAFPAILAGAFFLFQSCRKDYAEFPSPFQKGELVKLSGIKPRASFTPYNCCTCPCTVDTVYLDANYANLWFYNIHDQANVKLTHVDNTDLKKW